ncbi:ATP-binding cassette domain-containing protein [Helicobacter vulpis]|uniref:ATP-binding cassette domain-containing protein n=1 Tax=Helicobacter vulpis TaxID=2316076 RepID=UPI0013CDE945|nr:ATP-binding cassette domain-containing protein [Helicobacter vulpis]
MPLNIHTLHYCGSENLKPLHPLSVENLSFAEHTSTALIGSNGAGKSTLLGALLGFRPDFALQASLNGIAYANTTPPLRAKVGYSAPSINFPAGLKAKDLVKFYEHIYGSCQLDFFAQDLLSKLYDSFSDGQKQRLKLDLSLGHNPDLLILDEPESSLDEPTIMRVAEAISARNKDKKTSLIATHNAAILQSCTRVLCLHRGRILQHGTLTEGILTLLGDLALEVSYENEAECQDITQTLKDKYQLTMRLDSQHAIFFGTTALKDCLREPPLSTKRMGLDLRPTKAQDLLLALNHWEKE